MYTYIHIYIRILFCDSTMRLIGPPCAAIVVASCVQKGPKAGRQMRWAQLTSTLLLPTRDRCSGWRHLPPPCAPRNWPSPHSTQKVPAGKANSRRASLPWVQYEM